MKNIITTLKKNNKLFSDQLVAIKNNKSWGQLVPGLSAVIVEGNLVGFLWSTGETTYNRYGGKNSWDVIYSAMYRGYAFKEEGAEDLNLLYLENETPTTINFGRRNGEDYRYVLVDDWGRPIKFHLKEIKMEYFPLIYALVPQLSHRQWNGKRTYRDIFVPKKVLYPYAEDNEPVLCCTYINNVGFVSAYWDGEMVYWKNEDKPLNKLSWCFLPKSKEELIDKIHSKETPIEEPIEEEYTSSSVEERPRRKRRTTPRTATPQE